MNPVTIGCAEACARITGKIKTNSTSKIRKTIAIRKKRRDRGKRGVDLGVKPHSNGLLFSRSKLNLVDSLRPRITSKPPKPPTILKAIKNLII